MDTTDLRKAYEAFLSAANVAGNSDASDDRGWTVPMVVTHVSSNDALILAHLHGAVAGGSSYDNTPVIDDDALRLITTSTSWDRLMDGARTSAAEVLDVVATLDEEVGARVLPTKIVDGGEPIVDGPLPVSAFLGAQINVHLPMHTAQIRSIRAR
jgi:hypothetical protein